MIFLFIESLLLSLYTRSELLLSVFSSFYHRLRPLLLSSLLCHVFNDLIMIDFSKDELPQTTPCGLCLFIIKVQGHRLGFMVVCVKGAKLEQLGISTDWPSRGKLLRDSHAYCRCWLSLLLLSLCICCNERVREALLNC